MGLPSPSIHPNLNFFRNLKISNFGMSKKMMSQSQAKIKPSFSQYPFLTIFNFKKVSCEQIYDFKSHLSSYIAMRMITLYIL